MSVEVQVTSTRPGIVCIVWGDERFFYHYFVFNYLELTRPTNDPSFRARDMQVDYERLH